MKMQSPGCRAVEGDKYMIRRLSRRFVLWLNESRKFNSVGGKATVDAAVDMYHPCVIGVSYIYYMYGHTLEMILVYISVGSACCSFLD